VSGPGRVDAELVRSDDHVVVRWTAGTTSGSCRFDHLPGTAPA